MIFPLVQKSGVIRKASHFYSDSSISISYFLCFTTPVLGTFGTEVVCSKMLLGNNRSRFYRQIIFQAVEVEFVMLSIVVVVVLAGYVKLSLMHLIP